MNMMSHRDKTKEELIIEFKELQQKYNSLKESYDTDITEVKQAEEHFNREHVNFLKIFAAAPVGLMLLDRDTFITQVNKTAADMVLRDPIELIGKLVGHGLECLHIAERPNGCGFGLNCPECPLRQGIESVFTSGQSIQGAEINITMHIGGKPQERWLIFNAEPIEIDGKQLVIVAIDDITERKLAEEVLRESAARLNLALQSACMSVWHWDIIEDKRYFDDQVCYLLGINPATFTGSAEEFLGAVHPDDRQMIKTALARTIGQDVLYEPEYRAVWQDKSIHYIAARGRLSRDDKGTPSRINGIIWDITERKRVEEALRSGEERYRFSLEITGQIGWSIPPDGLVEDMPLWRQYSGQSIEEVKGWKWLDSVHPDDREHAYKVWVNAVTQKCKYETEYRIRRADGVYRYFMVRGIPLFNTDGTVREWTGTCIDITERKQEEQELIIAKEHAEESNRLKTAFLNNISHEIRTPFNGILGFLSIIQDDDLTSSERDEYISIINKSACRLMNTINDIVEISQIQAGQMKLTATETNIKSLTGELFDLFKSDAESQGLEFTINNDLPNNIESVSTDGVKLKTILSILIGNAIKFTKAGSIEFGIRLVDKVDEHAVETYDRASLQFSIKDTGIGIPENKQQAIFERFMQVDGSNTRQFEGSGLGLSIASAYAEMLGGKIWVESDPEGKSGGKGSVFYFTIPYNDEQEEKEVFNKVVFD